MSYFSPQEIATSDHKPVGAVLLVPTVWRNTVEEPARHSAATQGALSAVHALHMPFGGGANAGGSGHGGAFGGAGGGGGAAGGGGAGGAGGARVRLVFGQLRAEGLFVLRNRRKASSASSTEMPSPQVRRGCRWYPELDRPGVQCPDDVASGAYLAGMPLRARYRSSTGHASLTAPCAPTAGHVAPSCFTWLPRVRSVVASQRTWPAAYCYPPPLSCPRMQLLLTGPCMRDAVAATRVVATSRSPVWADEEDSVLGPLTMDLKTAAMSEMAHFRWATVERSIYRCIMLGVISACCCHPKHFSLRLDCT